MAEVVNLRMARKRKARIKKAAAAAENRQRHGRSKAERVSEATEAERLRRSLEAHCRAPSDNEQ